MRTSGRAVRRNGTTLTERELDVIRLVAKGLRNRDIGKKLLISEGTVKIHLHNIYEKLHVDGRLMLSVYVRDKGMA
jgi:DNA-binding NarL/FixJ family response regulator